jgi:hypothetical protein
MACTDLYISMMWVYAKQNASVKSARRQTAVSVGSSAPTDWSVARQANGAIRSDSHYSAVLLLDVFFLVSTILKIKVNKIHV